MAAANHSVPSPLQVTRPHPSDNPLLFIFMLGGVTPSELRLIREVVASHRPGSQVSLFLSGVLFHRPRSERRSKNVVPLIKQRVGSM